jgi:uncharacterized protein YpiB (UPF0302 family)
MASEGKRNFGKYNKYNQKEEEAFWVFNYLK